MVKTTGVYQTGILQILNFYFHAGKQSDIKHEGAKEWSDIKLSGQRKSSFIHMNVSPCMMLLQSSCIYPQKLPG